MISKFHKPCFDMAKCKKNCKRCIILAAFFNNTPFGFLGEHMFWEKIPYMWYIPAFLGIH